MKRILILSMVPGALLVGALSATAQVRLTFSPSPARAGSDAKVVYIATTDLAAQPYLILRGRYRTPDAGYRRVGTIVQTAGRLLPNSAGVYEGTISVPDFAVFAAFAVEDSTGEIIDANDGRSFELLFSDGTSIHEESLQQRAYELMDRFWPEAVVALEEAAQEFPDHAWRWAILRASIIETPEALEWHNRKFEELDDQLSRRDYLEADDVSAMQLYSALTASTSLSEADPARQRAVYWHERLLREAPGHIRAVDLRVLDINWRYREDPQQRLAELEAIWEQVGPSHPRLFDAGIAAAEANARDADVIRWADRWIAADSTRLTRLSIALSRRSGTRSYGMDLLRTALSTLPTSMDTRRDLHVSRSQQARLDLSPRRRLLTALGQALIAEGSFAAATDTLRLAADAGWSVDAASAYAQAQLQVGDSLGAAVTLARVAVDPLADSAAADSARLLALSVVEVSEWKENQAAARRLFVREMMADTIGTRSETIREALPGTTADGLVLVVFWSHRCVYSRSALPRLLRSLQQGPLAGLPMIAATGEQDPEGAYEYARAVDLAQSAILQDQRYELANALNAQGTPAFVLIQGDRQLFAATSSLQTTSLRAIAVLRASEWGSE
jgi:hypothetical protein